MKFLCNLTFIISYIDSKMCKINLKDLIFIDESRKSGENSKDTLLFLEQRWDYASQYNHYPFDFIPNKFHSFEFQKAFRKWHVCNSQKMWQFAINAWRSIKNVFLHIFFIIQSPYTLITKNNSQYCSNFFFIHILNFFFKYCTLLAYKLLSDIYSKLPLSDKWKKSPSHFKPHINASQFRMPFSS